MAANTKIALSDKELELVCNTDWILTKHAIIQKVYELFGNAVPAMEAVIKDKCRHLPAAIFDNSAKISKGENYQMLPYVMLDYPRHFTKDDTLAIRTFFWWGHFFSVSLQLSGKYKQHCMPVIKNNFDDLCKGGYFICTAASPWQHHFEKDNYAAVSEIDKNEFENILQRQDFIKIAKPLAMRQWEGAPVFIVNTCKELAGLLQ